MGRRSPLQSKQQPVQPAGEPKLAVCNRKRCIPPASDGRLTDLDCNTLGLTESLRAALRFW